MPAVPSPADESALPIERLAELVRQALSAPQLKEGDPDDGLPRLFLAGQDDKGLMIVILKHGQDMYEMRVPSLSALATLAGPSLKPARDRATLALPYRPRTWKSPGADAKTLDGESTSSVHAGPTAQEVGGISALLGHAFAAASYTCRGPTQEAQGIEYKPINEDAVVLRGRRGDVRAGRPEIVSVGAFDQAGGEGSVAENSGAASAAAAQAFDEVIRSVETGEDPVQALRAAISKASEAVHALGVGAMTTFAAAVLVGQPEGERWRCRAHVAVVGDSRVLLVDASGAVRHRTKLHNLGALIAAGEVADASPKMALRFANALSRSVGAENDDPDVYEWELQPGDRIVVETDGVGDAHEFEQLPEGTWHADICADQQGRILAHTSTAADGVAALVGYALDQMADGYGKPDNIGVVVAQVLGPP
jgi:serine/threonine protein phosphatase PrpC